MKKIFIMTVIMVIMASCEKPSTSYTVEYDFDNTEMESDFLNVYEDVGGKWRSCRHELRTVTIDGEEHEYASGSINEYVSDEVSYLAVDVFGYREHGGHYRLDTTFVIKHGEMNVFRITDESRWTH